MKLEIHNLTKNYGSTRALDGVDMELEAGIYGLLGPNGAGKSTLINLITDNVKRETGEILWDGRDILELGQQFRRHLGFMPQYQGYYKNYTGQGFLEYMAYLKGLRPAQARERAEELLEQLNLTEVRKKPVGGYSGGMRQRIMLGQALIGDSKVLILDEPTAGVDPVERIHIRNQISRISENRIILIATHIVSDVEAIAKEIYLMKKGRVTVCGTPQELIQEVSAHTYELQMHEMSQLGTLQERFTVGNVYNGADGIHVRIIAEQPEEGMMPVKANLEDVYLYYNQVVQ